MAAGYAGPPRDAKGLRDVGPIAALEPGAAAERAAERPAGQPTAANSAAGSTGPTKTPEQERWLREQRKRLGIEPDPNDGPLKR